MTYQKRKADFLDFLQPHEFRNGESFNQLGTIIDKINEAFYQNTLNGKNAEELLNKSISSLFRENSPSAKDAKELAMFYLKTREQE